MNLMRFLDTPEGQALHKRLETIEQTNTVFPPKAVRFRALARNSDAIRVVILGQDPYHKFGQADGLAFSVPDAHKAPPSLKNIFKALEHDFGCTRTRTDLSDWAAQGVLLLNTLFTVEEGKPLSHAHLGYHLWMDDIFKQLNASKNPIVFLLWGKEAQSFAKKLTHPNHLILTTVHPSPLSAYRGFITAGHFAQTQAFLTQHGFEPIDFCGKHKGLNS